MNVVGLVSPTVQVTVVQQQPALHLALKLAQM